MYFTIRLITLIRILFLVQGMGTESEPIKVYTELYTLGILDCGFESDSLIWYGYSNNAWTLYANKSVTINARMYVSTNLTSGLFYRLNLQNVKPDDEQLFKCVGDNNQYFIQLNVYGTELNPVPYNMFKGASGSIKCAYESENLEWRKQENNEWITVANQEVTINNTKYSTSINIKSGLYNKLHVLNVQESDATIYRCKAKFQESYMQINLIGTKLNPIQYNILKGSICTIKCAYESDRLIWYKKQNDEWIVVANQHVSINNTKFSTSINIKSGLYNKLHVLNVQESDAILYRCRAKLQESYMQIKIIVIQLSLRFNKDILSTEETVSLTVSCISNGSPPAPTFSWKLGEKDVTSSSTISQRTAESNYTITVTSTLLHSVDRINNNQTLRCLASNTAYNASTEKTLNVKYAPSVTVSNYTFSYADGTKNIICNSSGNPDVYTYFKWEHKSTYGQLIRELDGNKTLTLPIIPQEIRYQDSGIYTCTASNGVISRNGSLNQTGSGFITINAVPVFTVDNIEYTYGELGKSVELVVHVFSGKSLFSVKWFKENYQMISTSEKYLFSEKRIAVNIKSHNKVVQFDGYRVTLTITNITLEDFSSYVLQVSNTIGQPVVYRKLLKPVGAPASPKNFKVKKIGHNNFMVHWNAGNGEGAIQAFFLEYRKQGSSLWRLQQIQTQDISEISCKYVYVLEDLDGGIVYEMRMFAENRFNRSTVTEIKLMETESEDRTTIVSTLVSGTVGFIIGILSLLIVGVIYCRLNRRNIKRKDNLPQTASQSINDDINEKDNRQEHLETKLGTDTENTTTRYQTVGLFDHLNTSDYLTATKDIISRTSTEAAIARYETLGLIDQPNSYEYLHAEKDMMSGTLTEAATARYETLGLTDQSNSYEHLHAKKALILGTDTEAATARYETLGMIDQPTAYDDLHSKKVADVKPHTDTENAAARYETFELTE